jgi:ketosteroid isomerase-like protein
MTPNKQTVERYLEGFRRGDHAMVLACVTDDVEWIIPGMFRVQGKAGFDAHIEEEGFTGRPEIETSRMTEEDDVVVGEGRVRGHRADGTAFVMAFCDVFEMRDGLIRRLTSYLVEER